MTETIDPATMCFACGKDNPIGLKITFTLDEPGTYQVICTIENHFNDGMEGTVTAA